MPELLLKGVPIGNIKGILFDKDGTLSNSERELLTLGRLRIQKAIELAIEKDFNPAQVKKLSSWLSLAYGITPTGVNPNGIIAVASRNQNLLCTATVISLLRTSWPNALELAKEIFQAADLIEEKAHSSFARRPLLPGVSHILQKFQRAGIKCALISNDTCSGIKNFLESNNLQESIPDFWSAEHHPAKPDPAAVVGICNIIGLPPNECALIGDADSDLKMAREAGVAITMGYVAGWSTPPTLTAHQHLIHNWNELTVEPNPKVLDNIGAT